MVEQSPVGVTATSRPRRTRLLGSGIRSVASHRVVSMRVIDHGLRTPFPCQGSESR